MDNYVGKTLNGCYEIQEIIGVGGMAVVYRAYDNIAQRTVAIKIMKDELMADEEFRRRFKNESKAIAVLSHPNIVKVYDVSFGEKLQYMAMEYIDGISLKEYIKQQKVLSTREVVYFTTQILKAIQHAHDRGIVHRDIKPQNIMLLHNGMIKVTDFGIARFSRNDSTRTMTGKAIGSVHYISPEQARGEQTDERSDIYSVGVMLYEMLTGRLPFQSDNAVSVAIMQLQADAKRPGEINPNIPKALEEITMKAMQKEPSERYSSASEMLMDFKAFKENPNVSFNYRYYTDEQPTKQMDAISIPIKSNFDTVSKDKTDDKDFTSKKMKNKIQLLKYIAIASVALCLVLVIVYVAFASGGTRYECPSLLELSYDEAEEKYGNIFGNIVKEEKYDATSAIGTIIGQSIPEKTRIKQGTDITVIVSKGTAGDETRVPNLIGKGLDEATELISISGLVLSDIVNEESELYSEGLVIRTDPEYNTLVYKNSPLTLYVSGGVESLKTKKVPNVMYQAVEDATSAFERAGISVGTITEENSNYPAGIVISQAVKANKMVEAGSKIDIVVSNGLKPIVLKFKLPNFQTTVEGNIKVYCNYQLQNSLTNNGILLKGQNYDISVTDDYASDDGSGQLIGEFEVHVNCSEFEGVIYSCKVNFTQKLVTDVKEYPYSYIPNLYGKSVFEATQILNSLGFGFTVETTYIPGSSAPSIKGQDPAGGNELYSTSTTIVTLYATQGQDYYIEKPSDLEENENIE